MTTIWKYVKSQSKFLIWLWLLVACESDYTKLVKAELAKGVRQDSLLLGIKFGDTRNDFYGRCFDLNRQRLVSQGPDNGSVQYMFTDSLVHKAPTEMRLLFFPTFDSKQSICEMKYELSYRAWAPWNRNLQSDSLKPKAMDLMKEWYGGNDFVMANVNDSVQWPVKVDGNRRLIVSIKDQQTVVVKVQDLLHPMFRHSISK